MKNLLFILAILSLPILASAEGVSVRGGANSVGDELFDDYENEGVVQLSNKQVEAIVRPIFKQTAKKIPGDWTYFQTFPYGFDSADGFLDLLSAGFSGIKWYLEPKALSQHGGCQNQTVLAVKKVVRACQSKLSVRIDKDFFQKNKNIQQALILHELLVYLQINYNPAIEDEGVREVGRLLRNPSTTQEELQDGLSKAGFGSYKTVNDIKSGEQRRAAWRNKCFAMGSSDPYCSEAIWGKPEKKSWFHF